MAKRRLPADSKAFQELVFREEAKWHRRRARMSFQRKLEVLDRLRERAKEIARFTPVCPAHEGFKPRDSTRHRALFLGHARMDVET